MADEKSTPENVTIRLEPERADVATNVYHIGRHEGYREAVLDMLPIFGAIGIGCAAILIIRHLES